MNEKEKLNMEYNQFSEKNTINVEVPMYEWILMSQYACGGLENAVRAIKDAYTLGFKEGVEGFINANK